MAIRFSLFYESPENCEYLKKIIDTAPQAELVETYTLKQLPAHVNSGSSVIFLEYLADRPELDQWIRKTAADYRNPSIFLFLKEVSTEQLWRALRLGVKECFAFPIRPEDFREALERLPVTPSSPGSPPRTGAISLLGVKGGVGTTFLAVNLGVFLAQAETRPVLALDLDLRYGQMVYFLDAKPQYTIIDLIDNLDRLDEHYLEGLCFRSDHGVQILPAPRRMEEAEMVAADQVNRVMAELKKPAAFSYVVVDAGHQLDEVALKALELSDRLILVANQSIPALSNAKRILEILPLLGLENVQLEIWLNSWQKRADVGLGEIKDFLGREVAAILPACPEEAERSINEGLPLAKSAPQHPWCRELREHADRLRGRAETAERASLWSRLNIFKRK
jgi:pilus assembly protein CpaE